MIGRMDEYETERDLGDVGVNLEQEGQGLSDPA